MSALRKLPAKFGAAAGKRAGGGKTSLSRAVAGMLEEPTAVASTRIAHDDLDALCGVWSRAEGKAFDRALIEQRALDPEVWSHKVRPA